MAYDGTHTVMGVQFDANGRPTDPNNPYSLNYNGTPMSAADLARYHQISNAEAYGINGGAPLHSGMHLHGPDYQAWYAQQAANAPPPAGWQGSGGAQQPQTGGVDPSTQGQAGGNMTPQGAGNFTPGANPQNPFNFGQNDAYQFAQQPGGYMDPSYAWRLQQGNDLLQNSAAARGGLLSGPTLKAITNYGQNAASQEYSNAYNRFNQDRGFNYGVDVNDRDFAANQANLDRQFGYNAAVGDRNFNYGTLKDMMNYGMQGTGQDADTQRLMATLLSQNALNMGQTQGAGTIGGSNAINSAISQFLQQYLSNNMMNRFFPS